MNQHKKSLSIAVIQQTPDIGGAETYMLTLLTGFMKRHHRVQMATNNKKFAKLAEDNNIPVTMIPVILDVIGNWKGLIKALMYLPYACWFYTTLVRRYKKDQVDVLFMSGFSEKMLVTFLCHLYRLPVVWLEHGPLTVIFPRNFGLPKALYVFCSQFTDVIVTPSLYTKKSLVKDGGLLSDKIVHIPDGVHIHEKKDMRHRSTDFIIGNVSRLTREKGQQYVIEAMPHILAELPKAKLLLIGAGLDKPYFQELITQQHVEDAVQVLDYVSDVDTFYDQMDVFVFPTVWDLEGFGLVSVEAMAHRLPVVASNFGPVPEIVDDNHTGILVKPHDASAIARAVIKLAKDEKLRIRFGENGYKKAKSVYNSERVVDEFVRLFYQAIR